MMGFGVFISPMAEDMGWSHGAVLLVFTLRDSHWVGVLVVGSFLHTHSVRLIFFLSTAIALLRDLYDQHSDNHRSVLFLVRVRRFGRAQCLFSVHDDIDYTVVRETARPGHGHHDVWQWRRAVYILAGDHLDDFCVELANGLHSPQRLDDRMFVRELLLYSQSSA
jgi:hypothetical protein